MKLSNYRLARGRSAAAIVVASSLLLLLGVVALGVGPAHVKWAFPLQNASTKPSSTKSPGSALRLFAQLPLYFEKNQGQSDPRVKFLAHGRGYGLFFTTNSAVLTLRPSAASDQHSGHQSSVLRMTFLRGNPHPKLKGENELPGKSNYFIGNDPAKWQHDIPQFGRVRYANLYPGIDLVFYGDRGQLEYDFEISPRADPGQLALKFGGVQHSSIDAEGNVVLAFSDGDVRLLTPHIYQVVAGEKRTISGRFQLRNNNEVGFELSPYDGSRKLVIDPVLTYSTYLGGSGDEGCSVILGTGTPVSGCPAVAVDPASNAYIAGSTTSADFPTATPFQAGLRGAANVFVAKLNAAANTLLFATYLGGNGKDYTAGVGVDSATNVVVGGTTSSNNFPTTADTTTTKAAFQRTPLNAHNHVFVTELNSSGNALNYSTYLSGNGTDTATGLAVGQSDQNAYVTGTTTSTNTPSSTSSFPATLGAYQTAPALGSRIQFFMSKVNPFQSGDSSLAYSTYFGGGNPSSGVAVGGGIAVDISNNVYITGGTNFVHVGAANDFPILNADQGCLNSPTITVTTTTCSASTANTDAFAAEFNPNAVTGAQLLYSTYLGGTGNDIGYGIATDGTSAYITGSTTSTDVPVAGTEVFQSTNGGGTDAFLGKLANPVTTGTTPGSVTLSYFTYIGGSGTDVGLAVAVDAIQGARITGWTNSPNLPVLNASIPVGYEGNNDAFVARIDTTATTSTATGHYLTYLGGTGTDYGTSIAVDPQNSSYVAGETSSGDFLTFAVPQSPAFQPNLAGPTDAFLSKFGPTLAFTLTGDSSPPTVGVGSQVSFAYTLTNTGDAASNVIFTDDLQSGASFTSATVSTGSCGSASGNVVSCTIGTLNAGASATATVVVTPTASTTPSTTSTRVGNIGRVDVAGCGSCTQSVPLSAIVNDYNIAVSPKTATVPAGVPATYTATVTPTGNIPESVAISCSSGLPTGATCTTTTGTIPNLSNGPVNTTLVINSTARVTTTTELRQLRMLRYAFWLPISGIAFMGIGFGSSRKRRLLQGMLLAGFCSLMVFQAGCSSKSSITTTTGTPAGTYLVTVTATSGSA
ncbi:MAG TPA: SBBP repeat-containing protein, partial [Terriglobales bacterium]|nr:SBBP repeat-containing protein [Terriglobales bacterium]